MQATCNNCANRGSSIYLRRRPCLCPKWWTVCRCGCWGSLQRCLGKCPAAGGSPHSLAQGGNCCTERRPSCPSSPPSPPAACNPPASPGCRCLPDLASIPHLCCQSRSEREIKKQGNKKITGSEVRCLFCGRPRSLETRALFRNIKPFVEEACGIVNITNENSLFDDLLVRVL